MLRDSQRLVLAALFCGACGGTKSPAPTDEPTPVTIAPPPAPPTTLTTKVDEAPPPGPPVPPSPPEPTTCTTAHLATTGACSDGLRCLLLLEVNATCKVAVARELPLPDDLDPGEGVLDLAWPRRDGSLFLVIGGETWRWGELPAPLTAPADALTKLTWNKAKVGVIEPEGYQFGLETDGKSVFLVGCAAWDDGGGEESEEWDCTKTLFVDPKTKKKARRAPTPPFMVPFEREVAPVIALTMIGGEAACISGSDPPETFEDDLPDAFVTLGPSDWLGITYRAGSRMHARWRADADYYRGCEQDGNVTGMIRVGPDGFWARSTEAGWQLQHGPVRSGLSDATGTLRAFGDGPLAWTGD